MESLQKSRLQIMTDDTENLWPLLVFLVGDQEYALPISQVIEVAAMVKLMKMPDARPEVIGVANRRGAALPILDLRAIFGDQVGAITGSTLFIVAQDNNKRVGLVVDAVHQVEYVHLSAAQITGATSKYIQSVVSHGSNLIQVMALSSLIKTFLPELTAAMDLEGEPNYED